MDEVKDGVSDGKALSKNDAQFFMHQFVIRFSDNIPYVIDL